MTLPQKGVRTGNCARKNLKLRNAIAIATGAALSSIVQVSGAAEVIERRTVSATDRLSLAMGPGGGAAIRFKVLQ